MSTPTTTRLLLDPSGTPIPQIWDPVLSAWVAFSTLNTFQIGLAAGNASGYHFGVQAMNGPGWFKGVAGYYKGSVPAWIMIFNTIGATGSNVVPLYATPLQPVVAGQGDQPWFISPGAPIYMSAGIWIAISTTGGEFTPSTSTDMAGTVEFYAVGT